EHLAADCAHCRQTLAWMDRTTQSIRAVQDMRVPRTLVERLHDLYAERFRMPARRPLFARLTFDSRSTPALATARGATEEAFRLNYSTDLHDIEIWEEPAAQGQWYLIGQVLPHEGDAVFQPLEVVLTGEDGRKV